MKENLLAIINDIKENSGSDKVDQISEGTRLRDDLGFDSFQLAELTVHIEEEYGIDIFEDGIVNTIGEIINKLS